MLATTINHLFPGISFEYECVIEDAGTGPIIKQWNRPESQPTQAEIEAAYPSALKAIRIEADRIECRRRLTEHYGDALEQVSRASGLYGTVAQANHAAGVQACIDASNVARDQINAAITVAQIEAVTVMWPVLV